MFIKIRAVKVILSKMHNSTSNLTQFCPKNQNNSLINPTIDYT